MNKTMRWGARAALALCVMGATVGCGSQDPEGGLPDDPGVLSPGPTDKPDLLEEQRAFLEQYEGVRQEAALMSAEQFQTRYATPQRLDRVAHDPTRAAFYDEISTFARIAPAQEELLKQNGFVVLDHAAYRTFEVAYEELYMGDLPVFITSDSLLYALHRSYDAILMHLEYTALIPELTAMLAQMHEALGARLDGGTIPEGLAEEARDVDLYLAVARTLLTGQRVPTLLGGEQEDRLNKILNDAEGLQPAPLHIFGQAIDPYDYSQLQPRGHYEDDPTLQRYFKAMMWLGRTELKMVEFPDGQTRFMRGGLEAAFLMYALLKDSGALERQARIDLTIERMVGEQDSMGIDDMGAFAAAEGLDSLDAIAAASDEELRDALLESPYGLQRIMSQIIYTDPNTPTVVLPRVFLLLGQRFVIDSYVFHHVTYDRIVDLKSGQKKPRMLPSELDVQFALGSNAAGELLEGELDRWGYQGTLHQLRFLVESHPQSFWSSNLYNGWLDALRALNDQSEREALPEAMQTRAWELKTLNTQLASWAELRHDTILYAKQSYSGGITCTYPDAYVEPVPAFYDRMAALGRLGEQMSGELEEAGFNVEPVANYFQAMTATMTTLEAIAKKELQGEALNDEEFAFLQATIEKEIVGCGEEHYDGWYAGLFFNPSDIANFKPTIADVHTAPTDEVGTPVGNVLHGATGFSRLMVFTLEDCEGAKAYVGPVSTYHSVLTENFQRRTDSQWEQELGGDTTTPEWTSAFKR